MTGPAGSPISLVDLGSVGSTNDEAMRLALAGAPDWTVVRAVSQSAGRGRRGRSFVSPPGNSYTSFILRPRMAPGRAAQIALVAGLAVAEALAVVAPGLPRALCKWPNDVLVEGNKVCGILVEASSGSGELDAVIVGIGINLVSHPEIPGARIADLATLGAPGIGRDAMLTALACRLGDCVSIWEKRGFGALREAWLERAAGMGKAVRIEDGTRTLTGDYVDVDADGALVVADDARTRHRIVSGTLVLEDAA